MTLTVIYPTAEKIFSEIKEFIKTNDVIPSDWDEFVYDFIGDKYDDQFEDDPNWFTDAESVDSDVKDDLRDEVLELFGIEL